MSLRSAPAWKLPAGPWTRPVLQAKPRYQPRCRQLRSYATESSAKPKEKGEGRIGKPTLGHKELFINEGVPGFLSADAVRAAWLDHQSYLIDSLNRRTSQSVDGKLGPKALAIKYARDPSNAALFNYASMAHNNHFFFKTLSPQRTDVPAELASEIDESFGSLAALRTQMLTSAAAMFGPGFTWLVAQRHGYGARRTGRTIELGVLNTYLAGSPYPGAHFRRQTEDQATARTDARAGQSADQYRSDRRAARRGEPAADGFGGPPAGYGGYGQGGSGYGGSGHGSGAYGRSMRRFSTGAPRGIALQSADTEHATGPAGIDMDVLLCVSTWEHVYMWDYGPWGKMKYLNYWWDRIDWPQVNRHWIRSSATEKPEGREEQGQTRSPYIF